MRWVWPTSRHVRLSLLKHPLLPKTGAPLRRPNNSAPQLQNSGRRYVATEEKPRPRLLRLGSLSPRPRLHFPKEQTVAKHGKPPLNAPEYTEANEHQKANTDSETVEQGDTSEPTKVEGPTTTSEPDDIAKSTKAAKSVKTADCEPFELARVAGYQKFEEYPNVSNRTTIAEDPDLRPTGHNSSASTYTPPQEPLATRSSYYTGCSIDGHGQLRIESTAAALRKHRVALLLSSVSRNMVEADFTRLLAHTPDRGNDRGGLVRAIPGRDADFNRLSYWILLFDSPYNAASFQHRLRWYHTNATLNLPVHPCAAATMKKRELTPPEGYVDPLSGEDTWKRLHEFALLLPTQRFNVTAMLEPFPDTILTNLGNHKLWKFPVSNNETWPVRMWLDDHVLSTATVERFLIADGKERKAEWDLLLGAERIEPMVYTAFNSKGDRLDREGRQISRQDLALLHASPQKNCIVRFRTNAGALLFWRTWHRRPFPEPLSQSPTEERLLHVDPLW